MTTLIEEKNRQIADYKGLLNLANARNDLLQKEIYDLMQLLKYPELFNEWRENRKLKWIPVSEKLPKKPDEYPKCELRRMYFLVSLESGCVKSLGFDFDDNRWHTTASPVVAWMKLPEPYTEGR